MPINELITKKIKIEWVLLIIIILLNGWVLLRWVNQDTRPPAWDESIHTRVAFEYQERLEEDGIFSILNPAYFNYPPLYHVTLIPFLNWVPEVADLGAYANFFYLIILILSVYLIGKDLLGTYKGVWAAFLVTTYPVLIWISRNTMTDLALTAWVALGILCLMRSDSFSKRNWSAGFGLVLGMGMLTKWTMLAYLLGPLIYESIKAYRLKNFKNWFWAFGISGLIMGPWYAVNLVPMLTRVKHVSNLVPASGIIFRRELGLVWYFMSLFQEMYMLSVFLFIPGLIYCLKNKKLRILAIWFLVSLGLFSLIHNKNIRYALPALPAAALMTLAWIPDRKKWAHPTMGAGILILFVLIHFYKGPFRGVQWGSIQAPFLESMPPHVENWRHLEIIQKIKELKDPKVPFARVVVVSNAPYFHSTSLNLNLKPMGVTDFSFRGPSKRRWLEFAEFVLYKSGDKGPEFTLGSLKDKVEFLDNPPSWFGRVFKLKARWPLPDQTEALLFQAQPDAVSLPETGIFNMELEELELPRIVARGVKIRMVPESKAATNQGRFKKMNFSARSLEYKKIKFEDVVIALVEPWINLPLYQDTQEIQFLRLGRLAPTAVIRTQTLLDYAAHKIKWLKNPRIEFNDSLINVSGRAGGIPIFLSAQILVNQESLITRLNKLKIGGIRFPLLFIKAVTNQEIPLYPYRETPFFLDINSIKGIEGAMMLNPGME